jgi:inorganic pyrophosphatase
MLINTNVAHPWHGVPIGLHAPGIVNAFIEIVPADNIKYEIDKQSGLLKVDRPQLYSNIVPCLYGFIPQTYCNTLIMELAIANGFSNVLYGDRDPLDICVLTSKNISRNYLLLEAIPIGGFKLIDNNEADDKIIAVLKGDSAYLNCNNLDDLGQPVIDQLKHYFLTYKCLPGNVQTVQIGKTYGQKEAYQVINAAAEDYQNMYVKAQN